MSAIQGYGTETAAQLLAQQNAQANGAAKATAMDSTSGTSSSSSSSSTDDDSDITSQDFLTLLVTELQNQDPTQPTDPNEYVQQMVGVNSLEQLIQINQDLGGNTSSTTSTDTSSNGQATSQAVKAGSGFQV